MSPIHYVNLTRGLLCLHLDKGNTIRCSRIQSTHCEQKRWDAVLYGAGPDLLYAAATGQSIIVHDVSERERETRAMWQGLTWVRYAAERAWGLQRTPINGRGGRAMEQYFDSAYRALDDPAVRYLVYYRQHLATRFLDLRSCWDGSALTPYPDPLAEPLTPGPDGAT